MLSLKELQHKVAKQLTEKTEEPEQMTLGFENEALHKKFIRKAKTWYRITKKNLVISGLMLNPWIWIANSYALGVSIVFYMLIDSEYGNISSQIGISLMGNGRFDFLIEKNYLYVFPLINIIIIPIILILGYKYSKKLDHILFVLIFTIVIFTPVEFFALRNLIAYFSV